MGSPPLSRIVWVLLASGTALARPGPPAEPNPRSYQVRLSSPSRVVVVPRDPSCGPSHASCDPAGCFVPSPYVDRPPSDPATIACARDSDCTVSRTVCCADPSDPDGSDPARIDIRTLRADRLDALPARVCGQGPVCGSGPPEPALLDSLHHGCVEGRCRMLEPFAPEWCEDRDTRYRIRQLDGTIVAHERTDYGFSDAPARNLAFDCYRELARVAPQPPAALQRCERDTDCALAPIDCCSTGSSGYRAVRASAVDAWKGQICLDTVKCPTVVPSPPPWELNVACLSGRCALVEGRDDAECAPPPQGANGRPSSAEEAILGR